MKVHYLGNEFVESDSLAIRMAESLKPEGVEFIKVHTFSQLMNIHEGQVFMDVCEGIGRAELIEDIDRFAGTKSSTAHDIDFCFFLKLKKNLGEIKKVKIICLPKKQYDNIEGDILRMIRVIK